MALPALAVLVARFVAGGMARKQATTKAKDVLKDMVRKPKDQPKKGQQELWKGEAGPNVKRPKGPGRDEHYELDRGPAQGDLFNKYAAKLRIVKD